MQRTAQHNNSPLYDYALHHLLKRLSLFKTSKNKVLLFSRLTVINLCTTAWQKYWLMWTTMINYIFELGAAKQAMCMIRLCSLRRNCWPAALPSNNITRIDSHKSLSSYQSNNRPHGWTRYTVTNVPIGHTARLRYIGTSVPVGLTQWFRYFFQSTLLSIN